MPDATASPLTGAIITGAGGFLGCALARHLERRGVPIRGLDLRASASDHAIRCVDLSNRESASAAIAVSVEELGARVAVFHLAGLANAGLCKADPSAAFTANVTATANVLEACRRVGVSRIVFPSTALVYALPGPLPITEQAPLGPRSIYAATKVAAEAILGGYAADYNFSVDIARLGNVYGPGGPADSVASTLLRQVVGDGHVHLRTLAPVRDFIHRDDVVEGLIRLAEAGVEPGLRICNLSSGVGTSIAELAGLANQAVGNARPAVETEPGTGREDRITLDVQLLKRRTGWAPAIPLRDGVRETLQAIREERR